MTGLRLRAGLVEPYLVFVVTLAMVAPGAAGLACTFTT